MRILFALLVAVGLAATASAGQMALPTTLDKLLTTGDFVMVGDFKFEGFDYPADNILLGDMPSASQITVQVAPDNDGLRFTGPFFDLPGGAGNGGSDATLSFDVIALGAPIASASLEANPSQKGTGGGIAEIVETFAGVDGVKLLVFDKPSIGTLQTVSTADFDEPQAELSILKNILLLSKGDAATISVIDQTFTTIPEPTGHALAMLGIVTVLMYRRRRR